MQYLKERREALGGSLPARRGPVSAVEGARRGFRQGLRRPAAATRSRPRPASSWTCCAGCCATRSSASASCRSFPTRRAPSAWTRSSPSTTSTRNVGQLYEPVDAEFQQAAYREAKDGQILEEGITEAGSMSSFIAAGTAYATHGVPTIPFFIYYSMFGFQRIGDLIWAAADMRTRGFLLGAPPAAPRSTAKACSTRTATATCCASTVPNRRGLRSGFAYRAGRHRPRRHPPDVRGGDGRHLLLHHALQRKLRRCCRCRRASAEGILKGMYKLRPAANAKAKAPKVHLFGSGPILPHALRAQEMLAEQFGVAADVWSVTSYKELRREALEAERWNLLHPTEKPRQSYLADAAGQGGQASFVAASDYMRAVPEMIAPLGAGRSVRAGHRRLRPQRDAGGPAAALRGRRRVHRRGGAVAAGPARPGQARRGAAGDPEVRHRPGKDQPDAGVKSSLSLPVAARAKVVQTCILTRYASRLSVLRVARSEATWRARSNCRR